MRVLTHWRVYGQTPFGIFHDWELRYVDIHVWTLRITFVWGD